MINGIINVYKEKGFTSHDVVAKLRGILHQKKIGHTGTLDPDAVGVLPVCLGNGTKLCDMLTDTDKVYRASMILGMTTDTQDTSGELLSECCADVDEAAVIEAVQSFVGGYDQTPPMYSALKIHGKKLYELAREGREVDRPARRVMINRIDIETVEPVTEASMKLLIQKNSQTNDTTVAGIPFKALPQAFPKMLVTMTVHCSKGTYIRTLCHDIGSRLGVGGCMCALTRIRVGSFLVEQAKTLAAIEAAVADGSFENDVTSVDAMFETLPGVTVDVFGDRLLHNGNPLPEAHVHRCAGPGGKRWEQSLMNDGDQVCVYGLDGRFQAIYQYCGKQREFKAVKMFL